MFSSIRLVKSSKYVGQGAKIKQFLFSAKYNIGFNTFIFLFDAKAMVLTKNIDSFIYGNEIEYVKTSLTSIFHYFLRKRFFYK